nr:hypothetical protein [Pseudonocardiales bacterium]
RQGFKAGVSQFAPTGWLESSRYDMTMLGWLKKASHVVVTMDHATIDENVVVSYRTDRGPETGWTTLGTITAQGQTYLYLDPNGDGAPEGLAFEWFQFRWDFARGADPSQTPIMRAFSFHFRKIPQPAESFTITIALSPEEDNAQSADIIRARLKRLSEAEEFLTLVHRDQHYRGDLTSTSGSDGTGEENAGQRVLTFVSLPVRTGSAS